MLAAPRRPACSLLSSAARHLFLPRPNPRASFTQVAYSSPATSPLARSHHTLPVTSLAAETPAVKAGEAPWWKANAQVEASHHHGSHFGLLPAHMVST
jgi:hypothetical protein